MSRGERNVKKGNRRQVARIMEKRKTGKRNKRKGEGKEKIIVLEG